MKEWSIDIKENRKVFVDGDKLDTYGIKLEKEIRLLSNKGPRYTKKLNRLKKLFKFHKGL
jgi:hypothetical protein